jgi:hypothetical protein
MLLLMDLTSKLREGNSGAVSVKPSRIYVKDSIYKVRQRGKSRSVFSSETIKPMFIPALFLTLCSVGNSIIRFQKVRRFKKIFYQI